MRDLIALVDATAFYASCEEVFDPRLVGKPIVVLSNNDGMVVAANQLAKDLGYTLGAGPWYEIGAAAEARGVIARSSNYELYGDLSHRFADVLGRYSAWQEVYSIDESFLGLKVDRLEDATRLGWEIRRRVQRLVGIPVKVAIGSTKTRAKIASIGAKRLGGVANLEAYTPAQQDRILSEIPASEVWGVARRLTRRLGAFSVSTARELRDADVQRIRKRFSVVLARTVLELRGIRCLELDPPAEAKEQLIYSRSFAVPVTTPEAMRQVLSIYAQKVAGRLRAQGSVAKQLSVFAGTSHYAAGTPSFPSVGVTLEVPTDDPRFIAAASIGALLPRLDPDARYVRAGVMLTHFSAVGTHQYLEPFQTAIDDRGLGATLDQVSDRFGDGALGLGYAGLRRDPPWTMRRAMLSPRPTTHWNELAVAFAR